ncbi:MAG: hypothetical protein AVDCRST_MAG51-1051 [uncultured Ramlibacter sp.]|uniref:Uncharacterized protein n=1 Tax=uncultured Ramlibacter sp. TaxID=260755 RepID=A0A6J4P630_9BURK|nr:MAG: hypothetical protein AVDCRST_MAG51-1051 [uncultured Ramlibacter sp.]
MSVDADLPEKAPAAGGPAAGEIQMNALSGTSVFAQMEK